MAQVITMEQLRNFIQFQTRLLNNAISTVNALITFREQLFRTFEPPTSINSTIIAHLLNIETIVDIIGVDLGALNWQNAEEVRIGTPFDHDNLLFTNSTKFIEAKDVNNAATNPFGTFNVSDKVRIENAEDEDNRLLATVAAETTTRMTVTDAIVDDTDKKANIVLAER